MVQKTLQAELNENYDVCINLTIENLEETFSDICGRNNVDDK